MGNRYVSKLNAYNNIYFQRNGESKKKKKKSISGSLRKGEFIKGIFASTVVLVFFSLRSAVRGVFSSDLQRQSNDNTRFSVRKAIDREKLGSGCRQSRRPRYENRKTADVTATAAARAHGPESQNPRGTYPRRD